MSRDDVWDTCRVTIMKALRSFSNNTSNFACSIGTHHTKLPQYHHFHRDSTNDELQKKPPNPPFMRLDVQRWRGINDRESKFNTYHRYQLGPHLINLFQIDILTFYDDFSCWLGTCPSSITAEVKIILGRVLGCSYFAQHSRKQNAAALTIMLYFSGIRKRPTWIH